MGAGDAQLRGVGCSGDVPQERGPAGVPVGGGAGGTHQHYLRPHCQHRARWETLRGLLPHPRAAPRECPLSLRGGGCVCDNWGDPPAVSPLSPSIPSQGTGKWYELQDLQVTDILPQMITLSEAYIQVRGFGDSEGGVPGDACHPPKLSPRPTLTPSSPLCHRSGSGARRTRRTNKAPEPLRDTRNLPWGCLFPPRGHPEPP